LAPRELPETDPERLLSETIDACHRALVAVIRSCVYVMEQRAAELGVDEPTEVLEAWRGDAERLMAVSRRGRRGGPLMWNRPGSPTLRVVPPIEG
jgi:hypothetical protein